MKVAIVYVFPENGNNGHLDRALKFVASYQANPPMHDHETVIVCNGCRCTDETRFLFESLPNLQFLEHDDSGFDIGAYQLAAQRVPADMMVFLGGNTYFRGMGWLQRMVDVFQAFGEDHLYGSTGNQGNYVIGVWPHVRTTGFWCSPKTINAHPLRVTNNGLRYPYEHGPDGLTSWILRNQRQAWIVGWEDIRSIHNCDSMPEGYHQGSQSNVIVGDRMTEPPFHHCS